MFVESADRGDYIFGPCAGFRAFAGSCKLRAGGFDVGAEVFFILAKCLSLCESGERNVVFGETVFP